MGAPIGNQNGARGKEFRDALRKVLARDDWAALRSIAERLVEEAQNGESWAVKEVADRMDGKAVQGVELGGDPDKPLIQRIENIIVDAAS